MCVYLYHVTQWYIIYLEVLLLPPLRGGRMHTLIQTSGAVVGYHATTGLKRAPTTPDTFLRKQTARVPI